MNVIEKTALENGWSPQDSDTAEEFLQSEELRHYVILSTESAHDLLYWSNELGWADLDAATVFSASEKNTLNLPMGGAWRALSEPDT